MITTEKIISLGIGSHYCGCDMGYIRIEQLPGNLVWRVYWTKNF